MFLRMANWTHFSRFPASSLASPPLQPPWTAGYSPHPSAHLNLGVFAHAVLSAFPLQGQVQMSLPSMSYFLTLSGRINPSLIYAP